MQIFIICVHDSGMVFFSWRVLKEAQKIREKDNFFEKSNTVNIDLKVQRSFFLAFFSPARDGQKNLKIGTLKIEKNAKILPSPI